jgi:RES domain
MILFRHADPRFPFLWETADQPPGRWHGPQEGPVHYLADTPDGAWAEFLRHEGITSEAELVNVRRAIWAVEVPENGGPQPEVPALSQETMTGGLETYKDCQDEARRLRGAGATALHSPSAALLGGEARGWRVESGLQPGPPRDGAVFALFGPRPELVGWRAVFSGRPRPDILKCVRHL